MLTPGDHVALDPGGSDPVISLEPTAAEVAQCEAEVGTLLSIIAELNKTMGSLKAPRWAKFLAICGTAFCIQDIVMNLCSLKRITYFCLLI